jgi:predicted enzyme related to lactoylglutathione lyase
VAAKKKSKGKSAKRVAKKAKAMPRAKPTPKSKAKPKAKTRPQPARAAAPSAVPNGCGLISFHSDYSTHNLGEVKRFYTEQLGFTNFNHDPAFNYLWIQTTHGSSLGFMAPAPEMGQPMPPREPTIYLMVENVDTAYSRLSAKGVVFSGPPADMPWGHRVVLTKDPEGRSVMLAQDKSGRS